MITVAQLNELAARKNVLASRKKELETKKAELEAELEATYGPDWRQQYESDLATLSSWEESNVSTN